LVTSTDAFASWCFLSATDTITLSFGFSASVETWIQPSLLSRGGEGLLVDLHRVGVGWASPESEGGDTLAADDPHGDAEGGPLLVCRSEVEPDDRALSSDRGAVQVNHEHVDLLRSTLRVE
jgi:hypothetical protein